MRKVAVFDFDGTLTTRDTLLEFIRHTHGSMSLYVGLALYAPIILAMKMHLYDNGKAKQRFFSHFYKGWSYLEFCSAGQRFADKIDNMVRLNVVNRLRRHCGNGDTVYVISASMAEWITPWCDRLGDIRVISTIVEVDEDDALTGRFDSPNCYGKEKVSALRKVEPDRGNYVLYAYGDSRGDREMLAYADYGYNVKKVDI